MENSQLWIPLGILISSFLGSWHCAGMCGPFAALTGARGQLWQYHLGRGIAYASLGALSGSFGKFFLSSSFVWLRTVGAIALAGVLITLGMQYLLNLEITWLSHSKAGSWFQTIYRRMYRFKVSRTSFAIGLIAGLLPCMWLYTYVMAAAAARTPLAGSLVMGLFWLGGLPALSAVAAMIRPSMKVAPLRKKQISGAVLVVAGLYALAAHFMGLHLLQINNPLSP